MTLRRPTLIALLAAALLVTAACTPTPRAKAEARRPNIVLVLVDDLSKNLVRHMPNVLALQRDGTAFTNYTVTDSLCCPSRASILTGRYPHNTGILKNHGSDGGFRLFHRRGHEKSTFATDLRAAGYRTAFLGKYLNEYLPRKTLVDGKPYVPPGWDQWFAGGNDYANVNYTLNENGKLRWYGERPADYLTDVLSAKAQDFITESAAAGKPFLVEVSTYTPHMPFAPAPRDANSFPGLLAPRPASFDRLPVNAPKWLAALPPLSAAMRARIDLDFRKRVQSVQAIDRMLGDLRATLTRTGAAGNTVVIFTSDNGYHLGEYRLSPGKQTAFDVDVNVPLIVAGPGVRVGGVISAPVENIDLRPTFADLAGASVPAQVDGRSFRSLLAGSAPALWRTAALIEHSDPADDPADPDYQRFSASVPPTYDAMRTTAFTYVEYADGSREFYDRRSDPHQLLNLAPKLTPQRLAELHGALRGLATCAGAQACGLAGRALG
ncbi:sulfatase [Actinoplanes sp. NPDC024001]|uniref:sulfatase family protein n=1 Tax=Actinoplanes sp. NPDC024001 TaxID=3154598 RepID=UPI0033BFCEC6